MASTESLIFDLLVRDRASDGLSKIGGSASSAAGNVDSLTRRLDDVGRKSVTARLALDGDKAAQAALDRIDARLIGLDRRTASPKLTVEGAARATAEVSALDLELDKLGKKGGSADAAASAVGSGGLAGPTGIIALVGAGVALSPVIATVSVGLGGLAAAAYASVAPILAAGTATAAQQQALAGLDPAQRAAYTSLGALKTQFAGFSKALEPQVFGVFNQGLKLAGGLLGDAEPVAAATGKALGVLVGDIGADLKTSQWQQFFGFMAQTAGPDIQQLGTLFVSLLNDLPPILEELQPMASGLLTVANAGAQLGGTLAALNPVISKNATQAADASKSSGGFWGSLVHLFDASKAGIGQVTGLSSATGAASNAMNKAGASAAAAAPQVGTLSGDLAILNSSTALATDATKAFDDAWQQFVGKSVSDQQAVLNTAAAFDAYNTSLKTNKSNSTAAQQAFLSIITSMQSGLSTMQTQGDAVSTVNRFYQTNIDKLKALHNLTPAERADVQNVTRDYITWANTTAGLTRQTDIAAASLKNNFLAQLGSITAHAPGVSTDVTNLANSILKTGNQSSATRADRAQLIADLKQAGLSADAARQLVNKLQGQIDAMHGKTVTVATSLTGEGGLVASATGSATKFFNLTTLPGKAGGGKVSGGTPGRDSVLAALMPGEVVVPTHMVQAGAVDHLRGKLPGFAGGGLVAAAPWAAGLAAGDVQGWAGNQVKAWAAAAAAMQATAAASAFVATQGGSGGFIQSLMRNMAAARGWTGSQWNALAAVENREAGWSMAATNPSSGAYGLAQFINGPSEYAQYGGNSTTATGQITGMLNYIAQRYGSPQGAWNHEVSFGWYGNGLNAVIGKPTLIGVGESGPEHVTVTPVGRAGGGVSGSTQTIIIKVDPAIAAITPDRRLGQHLAEHLLAHTRSGGRLYPAGTKPQ